jgi:hypothetical protein
MTLIKGFESDIIHLIILILILALEAWLGKTKLTKSGSLVELGARLFLTVLPGVNKMSEETATAAPTASAQGIKELLELVAGLKELALAAKVVLKDGKVNAEDIGALMLLLQKQEVVLAALSGLDKLDDECKDLSGDEVVQVVSALIQAGKAYKAQV